MAMALCSLLGMLAKSPQVSEHLAEFSTDEFIEWI
jgi:hypothetical protein